ncbi:hypothetical protein G3E45_004837 [Salmonella enterica subsp. enterica]|nr:hypothetical protein [Salmonella enterica subsp. enterica]EDU9708356.1 hypothetical protein [Salmonella enterica]EDW4014749.1 hypothetical protein [Salmonella enterica subsp. enterica serovar Havana]EGZ3797145.1 hypothetical protein [Salmonella enterica subsp. enterica serovar Newington]EGZ4373034.1 hypothetical protein [Salmonella enterica subsp. enterica serovar Cerro]
MSVRFRDACQGGGAYGKTAAPHPFRILVITPSLSVPLRVRACYARRSRTAGA